MIITEEFDLDSKKSITEEFDIDSKKSITEELDLDSKKPLTEELDLDFKKPLLHNHEIFKCAEIEPELYECQSCTNFQTNFLVHLQQHIRANHALQNPDPFEIYQCGNCDFTTYSKYLTIRHKLFIQCAPKSDCDTHDLQKNNFFHCDFCSYKVRRKESLLRHLENNHNEWYRCDKCTFVTKRKLLLKKHKKVHVPKWLECDQCTYFAMKKKSIRQHKIMKHGVRATWYQCGRCPYKSVFLMRLQQHHRSWHRYSQLQYNIVEMGVNSKSVEWFRCGQCPFRTRTHGDLRRHNLDKHGFLNVHELFDCRKRIVDHYTCAKCDNFQSDLCTHLKKHVREGHVVQDPEEYTVYKCHRCRFTTYSKYLDLRHGLFDDCVSADEDEFAQTEEEIEIRPPKRQSDKNLEEADRVELWFSCKICPFKSTKEGNLSKHMVYHGKKFFHCKYCKFKSLLKSDLQTHLVQHINEDLTYFQCAHCPFKTLFKGNLSKHVQKHSSTWVKCDQCQFKTKSTYNLSLHERLMHGVRFKWFYCDLCDFQTKRLYNLKLHQKVKHVTVEEKKTGAPNQTSDESGWFHCDQCTFKTKLKPSLKTHQQVHSENKYKCKYCDHTSKRRYNLKTHILQKHADPNNIEWLCCQQCDFKSKTKSILKRHIQERHSNEWVYCAQCPFKAKSKRLLISHLRVVHDCGKKFNMLQCEHCPYVSRNASTMWHHKWKHRQLMMEKGEGKE